MTAAAMPPEPLASPAPIFNPARRAILLVMTMFLLPFAVAFGLYWFEWRPTTLGNHGELIQPPRALPETGLRHADGRPLPTAELRGKWVLVLAGQGPCAADCRKNLQQMRQVQVALNKEMGRLSRVWISASHAGQAADPALAELRTSYPDLVIAAPDDGSAGEAWRTALDGTSYRFYVIDPLGNVMMRYTEKADPQGMRKDLERLLKYSWVG